MDRSPDGNAVEIILRWAIKITDVHRRLGGAVKVGHSGPGLATPNVIELSDMTGSQRFTARKDPPNRSQASQSAGRLAIQILQKHVQHGWHEVHDADVLFLDGFNNDQRIPFPAWHQEAEFGALQCPPEKLPHRDIKVVGRFL